jgi:hypothetical protein
MNVVKMKKENTKNQVADGAVLEVGVDELVAEGSKTRISVTTMITKTNQLWFENGSPQYSSYKKTLVGLLKGSTAGEVYSFIRQYSDNYEYKKGKK